MPELITKQEILDANINGLRSPIVVDFLMRLTKLERLNEFYNKLMVSGEEFTQAAIEELNITLDFDATDLDNLPTTGGFIVVANHPFGMIDGVLMLHLIAKKRPDIKILANFLLERIQPLADNFIGVNPFEKQQMQSIAGIKKALKHLQNGGVIGIFPAGEVSSIQDKRISDKAWDTAAIKLIQKAKVPVVPMYFDGNNSRIFHILGIINPHLRTAALAAEIFKKQDKTIPIRIGRPINTDEVAHFDTTERLSRYLRTRVYALGAPLDAAKSPLNIFKIFKPRLKKLLSAPKTIIDAVDTQLLIAEVADLRTQGKRIIERGSYEVFSTRAQQIPYMMREIARLREITFRAVGEGTNNKMDIDEYDMYYHQLFIWDTAENALVGAYRLGSGNEIVPRYGKNGLYISSMFDINVRLEPMLGESLEMGRSFVVKEYQGKPFSLFLLWQGILLTVQNNPQYKYLIGPVSISSSFSQFSQQLIIEFIQKYYYDYDLAQYVRPVTPFKSKQKNNQKEARILLENIDDIEMLDKIIAEIEPAHLRIPVLLKKYIKQNAKIICFNIDPQFNNTLDGLMVLKLDNLPPETIEMLAKM
jgi:putative hemolysin